MNHTAQQMDLIRSQPCLDCYLCKTQGVNLYQGLRDRLFSAPGTWNVKQCPNPECRLLWLDPMPLQEDVGQLALPPAPASLPEPKAKRLELQAALKNIEGQDALVDEVRGRYTPDLVLFGQATATGSDHGLMPGVSPDSGQTWNFDHPTYLVGAKLTTSLDWVLYQKVVNAAKLGAEQSRQDLAAKEKKSEQDWASLKGQWDALQEQLKIAQELEEIQKEKAEREKRRYFDGRTTNFQVLRFEEDYNQARIAGMRLRAQALALAAQARFYDREGF